MKFIKSCFLLVIFFTSCDCLQHVQGIVIDAETQLPINNVLVIKSAERIINTDSIGNFEFTAMTGGIFGCPKIVLSFEKEGYTRITKKYKSCCTDNVIVVLNKQTE